ncbi:meso-2,3-butanediol dehydrogenase-like [Dermacentor variabilis]|uniref:meso-2,3-butanediol dehydrogenase-like n=1 Tax=Dermacentor variabilis TaxID=34621 RepID=UPI003F5AFABE
MAALPRARKGAMPGGVEGAQGALEGAIYFGGCCVWGGPAGSTLKVNCDDDRVKASRRTEGRQLRVLVTTGDVVHEEDVAAVVQKTIQKFGRIDIVVNNAGIYLEGSTDSPSLDSYDQLMNVNLRGPIQVLRYALPYLRQVKGNVVNVSSVVSLRAAHHTMFYSVSKAGLDQLTKCTALENAEYGVRVNSVNPSVITTNLGRRPGESEEDHFQRQTKAMAHAHLLGRIGTMDEVACAIAFLASDDASFITGHALPVDGGHLLMTPLGIMPPDLLKQRKH